MPRGVYERKKKPGPAEKPARKTRAAKRRSGASPAKPTARATARTKGPRFGVWEDGRVEISTETCQGFLEPSAARELMEFMGRLGVK